MYQLKKGPIINAPDPRVKSLRQIQDKRGKILLKIKEIHASPEKWDENRPLYNRLRAFMDGLNWVLIKHKPEQTSEKKRKLIITKTR